MRLTSCRPLVSASVALAVAAGLAVGGSAVASSAPSLTFDGAPLAGTTVTSPGTVQVHAPGATTVTWILDGIYLEADESAPFQLSLSATDGDHELKARIHEVDGSRTRIAAEFRVQISQADEPPPASETPAPPPPSGPPPPPPPPPTEAPTPPVTARTLVVDGAPLAGATVTMPGTVEVAAPGAARVKWILDGSYLGVDESAPFE